LLVSAGGDRIGGVTVLEELVRKAFGRELPTRDEVLRVLAGHDDVLDVVAAAFRVRREFFGRRVKLDTIINLKSGLCPVDCTFCSQRLGSTAEIMKYSWIDPTEAANLAERAITAGVMRVRLVGSGRGPSDRDIRRIEGTVGAIKTDHPQVQVCVCLGLLKDGQAERLHEAGAYSHNLNASEERYGEICTTHTYDDRVDTVRKATKAGLSPCSGAIFGTGSRTTTSSTWHSRCGSWIRTRYR